MFYTRTYDPAFVTDVNSLTDINEIPKNFELFQNYPNPFNPLTTIEYNLPYQNFVTLSIYNRNGQLVATLYSNIQAAGVHKIVWDASNFASGIYFYCLNTESGFSDSKKMILLK